MNDHPISEELIAFAAGELDPQAGLRVEHHLAGCDRCRQTVALYSRVHNTLQTDDSVAPPVSAIERARAVFVPPQAAGNTNWAQRLAGRFSPPRRLISSAPSTLLAVFVILAMAMLLTPLISDALPGDVFYPVKLSVESLQLSVAIDDTSQIETQLAIADTRVKEMDALASQARYTAIPVLAADYAARVQTVTTKLDHVAAANPTAHATLATQAEKNLAQNSKTLADLTNASPAQVKPQIAQALGASTAAQSSVQQQLTHPPMISAPSPAPTATSTPTQTATATASRTATPSPTATRTPTMKPTVQPSATLAPTWTPTLSPVIIPSSTSTPLPATDTPVIDPSATPSPTGTPVSPTATLTPTPTKRLPRATPRARGSMTPTPTATFTATSTLTATIAITATMTVTETITPTLTPMETATPTPSPTYEFAPAAMGGTGGELRSGPLYPAGQYEQDTSALACNPRSLTCPAVTLTIRTAIIVALIWVGTIRLV